MKEICKSVKSVGIITLMAISFALFFFFQSPQAAEAVTVTVAPTNTAPTGITQGEKDDVARLELTTDAGTALWLGISVNLIGTATDSDINKVTIYKSADANWAETDIVIGQGNVSGGVANIAFTQNQTLSTSVSWRYFIVYTVSNTADISKTVGAQLVSPGSVSFDINSPDTMASTNLPFSSGTANITEIPDKMKMYGFNDVPSSIAKPPAGATRLESMLKLRPRAESKSTTWTAVRIQRTGTSSDAWINNVKIYDASGTTEFDPNTSVLLGSGGIDTTITLSPIQPISTTSSGYYFVVFEINDQATVGSTIGARIVNQSYVVVDSPDVVASLKNLDSKKTTFVGNPHGSPGNIGAYVNTNYCSACHNTHMARQNRRILNKLFTSDSSVVNNNPASVYNALCFSCHDGTGSSVNIKADYDAAASAKQKGAGDESGSVISPGHMTDQTGSVSGGYLSNLTYNAGTKLPCMVCHDVHQSRNNNYVMLADGLYEYAASTSETTTNNAASYYWDSSSTVWGSSSVDNYTRRKRCEVCHRNAVGTSDTTSTSGTGAWVDGKSVVVGIDLGRPETHDSGSKSTSWCGTCHGVHKITIPSPGGGAESAGGAACDGCHAASFYNPMQDSSSYHHYMQNAGVTNLLSSGTKYPTKNNFSSADTSSNERRCLMCHADHDAFSPATGGVPANGNRGANLRASIAVVPSAAEATSFSNTDFDAGQSEGGICVSCHEISQTKNTTNQKFTVAEDSTQTLVVTKDQFAEATTAHNYVATSTFPGTVNDNSTSAPFEFEANCVKCHNTMDSANYPYDSESDSGSMQNSQWRFQLHSSLLRRLLAWLNIVPQTSTQDPLEESYCNRCHSLADNPNSGSGQDYYNRKAMTTRALGIKVQIAKTYKHPVGGSLAKHTAVEGESSNWNPASNRHVECEDCHNPHAAQAIDANDSGGPSGANVSNAQKGVWGVAPEYSIYTTGTATFTEGSNTLTGTGTNWSSSNVSTGWYIKSHYDLDGRWYKVSGVNYGAQTMTVSQNFDGTRANLDGIAVEYTAVDTTLTRVNSATYEYEICFKCHTKYSYDDTPPNTPSNHAGGATVRETDIGNDFNSEQMAIHPVTALGKNQPGRADQSEMSGTNNWPLYTVGTVGVTSGNATVTGSSTTWLNMGGSGKTTIVPGWLIKVGSDTTGGPFDTGWYQVKSLDSDTIIKLTTAYAGTTGSTLGYKLGAGLGNAFVPPWGPWSRMKCSDCHGNNDDTGPRGPHGSTDKWILKTAITNLEFTWYDGTSVTTLSPNNEEVPTGGGTAASATSAIFCFNCHRRDVYGDEGLGGNADNSNTTLTPDALLSRINHDPSASSQTYAGGANNWGILCMNCHGGDSLGGIHGTTKFRGRDNSGVADPTMNYSGKRFLNGATWAGVKRASVGSPVQCWSKAGLGFSSSDEVNVCSRSHVADARGNSANYDYDLTDP